jgi:hypothetical protein
MQHGFFIFFLMTECFLTVQIKFFLTRIHIWFWLLSHQTPIKVSNVFLYHKISLIILLHFSEKFDK